MTATAATAPVVDSPAKATKKAIRPPVRRGSAIDPAMTSHARLYRASRAERFALIDQGVAAGVLSETIRVLGLPQDRTFKILGLPRSTMLKKIAAGQALDRTEGSLVVGLQRLIGQVETMVAESGDSTHFNAAKWLAGWMESPNPALGGRCPADYMRLPEGQEMLSQLLSQTQSGAYA